MTVTLDYPLRVLPPRSVSLTVDYNTRPGQQATNGMRRSVGMSGAQFRLTLKDIYLNSVTKVRTMRGFLANLEADSQLVRIRLPDMYGIDGPWSIATKANRQAWPLGIPFATDVLFSTGVGFAVPTLEATFAGAAALNARQIYVSAESELPGGCAVSINEFCYMIAGSWTEDDGSNRLKLSPVLRQDASQGDTVSLAPIFVGTCTTTTPGSEELDLGKRGAITLEFVEDLTRLVESVD
ncbi:hypothetical protein FJ959_18275 [Mesorhizobium sp. B2-2-4]|uniref:hypothetical protein n=1 Tax=unclassified Mesorhizobium TaxID=325217 RepID=UPI0011282B08|nr:MULTISPECIES: hypothetical protein [unclassified Mesorhizobium]TPM55352.1 hypothetical protein FJ959_18275 [Mesorhizobium sp. B2-2-4]TPM66319.1 hypothetical protein FJ965_14235 [Mesorhizobium sp. B2-2-1]TPN60598.1 hypothetical protein FJ984_30545 [Mesorhizobium sp. B1-1-3]